MSLRLTMVLSSRHLWTVSVVVILLFSGASEAISATLAKTKKVTQPPDLKILSVDGAPRPFVPSSSPFTLTIMVELPKSVPTDALLDVTTLIMSTSRSSFRVLTTRRMLTNHQEGKDLGAEPRRVEIVQTWDGKDNNAKTVAEGQYDYQIQAKLMVPNKSGAPLTRMTAWKKRGNIQIKSDRSSQAD